MVDDTIRVVNSSVAIQFPDPANYANIPVYDLLVAASSGHAGVDLRLIRAIVDRGEECIPDILRFASEDRDDDRVDLEADLITILRHLDAPAALPYFIGRIRRFPEEVPEDLIEAILPFREQALEPLLALYQDLDESRSSDLAFLLAGLGIRDERILKILLDRLEYDAADGAMSLGLYGDPAAIPALERILAEVPRADSDLRREIQHAIAELQSPNPPAPLASHKIELSAFYPEQAAPPYHVLDPQELIAMFGSGSAEHRVAAAEGLRDEELDDGALKVLLDHARNDPDPKVRGRCWETLGCKDSPEIRRAMKKVVSDVSLPAVERGGALVGLCNATDEPEVAARVREFYAIPELRAKALEAMWRSFDRQFSTYFARHLGDPDPEVRRQAVWGAGYMGIGAAAGELREMFDDDDFRDDALFAFALCVPGDFSRGRVRGILRKIDRLAGGLSGREAELVKTALDQRLAMHNLEPVFAVEDEHDHDQAHEEDEGPAAGPHLVRTAPSREAGRNDPCPCGSGKKYKKCHGA